MTWKVLFDFSPIGLAAKTVVSVLKAVNAFTVKTEIAMRDDELRKGINKVEEKFMTDTYGTVEMFFPARVLEEDLPLGFETAVGVKVTGSFIWKMSEWNDFWRWVSVLHHNSLHDEKVKLGRNGAWLVEIGKKRWEDAGLRKHANEMAVKYRYLWVASGMSRANENPTT